MDFKLKITSEEARELLKGIDARSFKESYEKYWNEEAGQAYFSSACWLYCWGISKLGCQKSSDAIKEIFEKMFHFTFDEFGSSYSLVLIGNYRYKKQKDFPGHNLG